MAKWDKMDRLSWNNSEVMSEFEKNMQAAMEKLAAQADLAEEKENARLEKEAQDISNKLKQINTDVQSASQGMNTFLDQAKNLAADPLQEEEEGEVEGEENEEILAAEARMHLLEELRMLAKTASVNLNGRLAYKIERAIDVIEYDEE